MPLDTSLYPFSARFQCFANVITPTDKEEMVAKASLSDLKALLPEGVDPDENPDLLYFAANGAVAGMSNSNGDSITVEKALELYPFTKNKYINVDHKKEIVIGTLLYPGLSAYGSNELITPEEAGKLDTFNLSLIGVVWKAIKKELIQVLINASDVTHPTFGRISLSWEIFFKDFDIAIGSKIINNARIISDPKEKVKYLPFLKCKGGPGFVDGEPIYRVITGDDVIIGGYSFVTNPAADVEGVAVILDKKVENNTLIIDDAAAKASLNNSLPAKNNAILISHSQKTIVNTKIDKIMPTILKIEDIAANWDSFKLLEATAAKNEIDELFKSGIRAADEQWRKQLVEKDEALAKVQTESKAALEQVQAVQKQLNETQAKLQDIENEKLNKVKAEVYNERMADIDSEYDLDDDDRQVLASKIKEIKADDESYASFKKEFAVMCKEKSKAYKDEAKKKMKEEFLKEHASALASAEKLNGKTPEQIAEEALASATLENITLTNGLSVNKNVLASMTETFTKGIKIAAPNRK